MALDKNFCKLPESGEALDYDTTHLGAQSFALKKI